MYTTNKSLFMGLMSGTSMDGIDAAIIDLSADTFIAGLSRPYSHATKKYLDGVLSGELASLQAFSQLNTLLGREFAAVALELLATSQIPARALKAIGSHGQTLGHDATAAIPYTIQLGCAHTIAELTGITVVADFRPRDLIAGGQGAPFAPIYHQALFRRSSLPLAVVNIGGIANVSYLVDEETVSGYDLGPGNCLMDAWIKKHLGHDYDKEGAWAASGHVIIPLLDKLLADPYLHRKPPKSIGKEYFSLEWLEQHLRPEHTTVDVQATLLRLTATTTALGIQMEGRAPKQVLICGGGAHNLALLKALDELLPQLMVASTASININPDYIEALMFAWLAEKTLSGTPLDLRNITGSTRPTILGAIYPATGIE